MIPVTTCAGVLIFCVMRSQGFGFALAFGLLTAASVPVLVYA